MDAAPALKEIARWLNECGLEAVLIGNAAAALGRPKEMAVLDILEQHPPGLKPEIREKFILMQVSFAPVPKSVHHTLARLPPTLSPFMS